MMLQSYLDLHVVPCEVKITVVRVIDEDGGDMYKFTRRLLNNKVIKGTL